MIKSLFIVFIVLFQSFVFYCRPQVASDSLLETLPEKIGFHDAVCDDSGKLLPWTSWSHALRLEMDWYLNCPVGTKGYPVFIYTTFMDENYKGYRDDFIPATQLGMGIISYLKYFKYTGKADPRVLKLARLMGDYLVEESLTPGEGAYPRFTRSTGHNTDFPLIRSAQGDEKLGVNVIEPDKGGIAGYALVMLYDAVKEQKYLDQAVRNADVLVKNMRKGDALHSPWPFRVDAVTGEHWGERSGNMVYILRLFDVLIEKGYDPFQKPRDELWKWIRDVQIPAPESRDSSLWVQFFEDMSPDDNRNSWAPMNTARYLIEKKETLDPDWKQLAGRCINFAMKHFALERPGGLTLMGEQDVDNRPWGGACSTLGGVAAMYYAAGGGEKYREIALRNLNWVSYFIDSDGGPAALCGGKGWKKGSWQEDCHTDKVHNFMDAIAAVPEWRSPRYPRKRVKLKPELQSLDKKDILCSHKAVYDDNGVLLPWTSWKDALSREMEYYQKCPVENGYPAFVTRTFLDGDFQQFRDWKTVIPAIQNGMGIISYLKYYTLTGKRDDGILRTAKSMGDYLVKECNTPDEGKYPRFTRSTGWAGAVPQPPDCGSQGDLPYEIEPDKGGIAGYALLCLYKETDNKLYLDQALQNARVLVRNMREGDGSRSPWPFRVDYRTGEYRGEVSGNMSFILRLFGRLAEMGYDEFEKPHEELWSWIVNYQIPNVQKDGMLWVQFFEDHAEEDNRVAWSVLNMARYLLEKRESLDTDWKEHAGMLIGFVDDNFTSVRNGVLVCGEQDYDKDPWGGVLSTYGAVLAMYSKVTGLEEYKNLAYQALNFALYATFDDGSVSETTIHFQKGVWQEDCHTDKIHNFMDAIGAYPEWGE